MPSKEQDTTPPTAPFEHAAKAYKEMYEEAQKKIQEIQEKILLAPSPSQP